MLTDKIKCGRQGIRINCVSPFVKQQFNIRTCVGTKPMDDLNTRLVIALRRALITQMPLESIPFGLN